MPGTGDRCSDTSCSTGRFQPRTTLLVGPLYKKAGGVSRLPRPSLQNAINKKTPAPKVERERR